MLRLYGVNADRDRLLIKWHDISLLFCVLKAATH